MGWLNWYWAVCDEGARYYSTPKWEHTPSMEFCATAMVLIPFFAAVAILWGAVLLYDGLEKRKRDLAKKQRQETEAERVRARNAEIDAAAVRPQRPWEV